MCSKTFKSLQLITAHELQVSLLICIIPLSKLSFDELKSPSGLYSAAHHLISAFEPFDFRMKHRILVKICWQNWNFGFWKTFEFGMLECIIYTVYFSLQFHLIQFWNSRIRSKEGTAFKAAFVSFFVAILQNQRDFHWKNKCLQLYWNLKFKTCIPKPHMPSAIRSFLKWPK